MARKANGRRYHRGKALRIPVGIQNSYVAHIDKLVNRMTKDVEDSYTKLFKTDYAQEHFQAVGMDASISSQVRILTNALKRKWDQLFGKAAMGLSPWMVDKMNHASAAGVASSIKGMPNLRKESGKLTIDVRKLDAPTKQILQASSDRSAKFIKSIPEQHLGKVSSAVYNSIANGKGLNDLQPFFESQNVKTGSWARLTALDQTRKTYNGLNAGRMKKVGVSKGEWIHSGGSQHPRELHEDFDGQTFDLNVGAPVGDDGGNEVMPGDEPNCRCTFAPVVPYDDDDD